MSPSVPDKAAPEKSINYTVFVLLQGAREVVRLKLTIVSEDDLEKKSEELDLSQAETQPYKREDPTRAGTSVRLSTSLPASFKPGMAI